MADNNKLMVGRKEDGLEYTTVKHYDPKVKAAVYHDFMNTNKDLVEIAIEHGVDRHVISAWSKEGGWLERRREIEKELMRAADDQYRAFVTENKIPVLRRQTRISGKLELAIEQLLEEELKNPTGKEGQVNSMVIKRLAESLAAVSGVSTKALGIADTVVETNSQGGGRVPLVAIGIGPSLPSERTMEKPTITIQEVEQ